MTTSASTAKPEQGSSIELTDSFGRPLCPWQIAMPDEPCPTCGEKGLAKRARAGARFGGRN